MVILGGMGNLFGGILGAVPIVALRELFREFDQDRLLAFALMLMVLMVFRPQGLLAFGAGGRRSRWTRWSPYPRRRPRVDRRTPACPRQRAADPLNAR